MKNKFLFLFCFVTAIFINTRIVAQVVANVDSLNKVYLNWYNLDHRHDKVEGVSTEKAYSKLLKNKSPKKLIIVAVIDGGLDTAHADLKGKVWKNTRETAGNGIDDDNNGYVDDIYGWNFIGNTKGENINSENLEYTRILRKLSPIYKNIKSKEALAPEQISDYNLYLSCKMKYDIELSKYKSEKKNVASYQTRIKDADTIIKVYLMKDKFTKADVEKISSTDEKITNAQNFLLDTYKKGLSLKSLNSYMSRDNLYIDKYLNLDFNAREIVGDDPENINDTKYGNPNVYGSSPDHGTLVAGLIAANRNNGIGINGIAENVKIMAIRVVPDGDERDKDIALAIRYAVDNGANIINMSFGKIFSPQKKFVDDAIKYAEAHNVLLVHAAGNDGLNNDSIEHYPSKKFNDGTSANTMINVGASNLKLDKDYAAFFSNYGQSVDLFAPGVNVISLFPGSRYDKTNGTSFSCPITSGVAALVWSYYPELTALELKNILLRSVASHANLKVNQPNKDSQTKTIVRFKTLCKTGGSVNAYNALKAADKFVNAKKNKVKIALN